MQVSVLHSVSVCKEIQLQEVLAQIEGFVITEWLFLNTAWKVSKYGVISGPYFPVFGLNTFSD